MVQLAGYLSGIIESRVSALEKWAREQRKRISDLRRDTSMVKESIPDMRKIKELLLEIKNGKILSDVSSYDVS